MRILNLSLDGNVIEKDSAVQKRLLSLAEKAGEITVFVPANRNAKMLLSPQLTVYAFGGPKLFQLFRMWRKAIEELQRKQYDLITVQDPYFLGFLAARLAEKFTVPLEVQVHGFEKMKGGRVRLAKFVLKKAHRIRVVSERLKHELLSRFSILDSLIYVLPVYTQIEIPQRMLKRKTVPYPFTFLTVGRLVPVKNIVMQIRAMAELAKQIPHIRLRIVGDGPEWSNLQLSIIKYQLESKVSLEGEQKDVSRFYEEADAFLLTSDSEGWGLVVLEAAAHKLPIIMTDVGLAREVIKNEESGLVVPVGDEYELARAMKELIDKPELRVRLGEEAFLVFKALPSPEAQIQKQCVEWQSFIKSYSL